MVIVLASASIVCSSSGSGWSVVLALGLCGPMIASAFSVGLSMSTNPGLVEFTNR